MDEKYKQELEKSGVDIKGSIDRFLGNEEMYDKFLKKTMDSPEFEKLEICLEQKDYKGAFRCAHTIKGVAGNLGLIPVEKTASAVTELLRGKEDSEVDVAAVHEENEEMQKAYQLLKEIINNN